MDRALPTAIVIVVLLGLFALMWRSWRRRSKRDAVLVAGYPAPATAAATLATASVLYVATTPREIPLERLAISGLAFRARATLTVATDGVTIAPSGETPVFVPAAAIERVTEATWAIDRGVETGGLLLVGWRLNSTDAPVHVDSYFRITDPADRVRIVDALRSIIPGASRPDLSTESEA